MVEIRRARRAGANYGAVWQAKPWPPDRRAARLRRGKVHVGFTGRRNPQIQPWSLRRVERRAHQVGFAVHLYWQRGVLIRLPRFLRLCAIIRRCTASEWREAALDERLPQHFMRRSPLHLFESALPEAISQDVPIRDREGVCESGGLLSVGPCLATIGFREGEHPSIMFPGQRKNPCKSMIHRGFSLVGVVPRRGLEPPRCYSLVPETSASTNSAIWAHIAAEAVMF